jgi:hypothetical protein
MKRKQQREQRLVIRHDTIRELGGLELEQIRGGDTGAGCTTGVILPQPAPKQ